MRYSWKEDGRSLTVLLLLAGLIFGFGLGSFGLLDPDEPFYSLTAKEMLARHDLSTPVLFGQPQFEKPILFYWVIYLSFKFLGISEFAARLGPLLAGLLTVVITYLWGVVLFHRRAIAFISAVILATAAEFFVVSKIVLTDIFLCLFITAALYCFSLGYGEPRIRRKAWFYIFVFCALGFLTKGPLAVILPWMGIVAFLLTSQEAHLLKEFPWIPGLVTFSLIGLPWYFLMTARYGVGFLEHFFVHENMRRFFFAEHQSSDRFFFYPGTLFLGFFPWSAFILGGIFYGFRHVLMKTRSRRYNKSFILLAYSFVLPFIFFTAAKSKLLSYLLPVFPAIALMMGAWMFLGCRALKTGARPKFSLVVLSLFFLGVVPLALVLGCAVYSGIKHLELLRPILAIGIFLIPLSWAALFSAYKRNYIRAFYCVIAGITVSSCFVFVWLMPKIQASFSSKDEALLYQKNIIPGRANLILANKMFVRGASYYTGSSNVSVLTEDPDSAFYSKHPVLMISKTEDLMRLDKNLFPVYCFLKPKDLKFLKRITDNKFSITTLRAGADRTFARLDRADNFLSK